MVGAGGNAGSLITNSAFFVGSARTDTGFINMGTMILAVTCLLIFVYFPESGGMFLKAGAINYDPQRIKPPEGYRGADSMDFANVQTPVDAKEADDTAKAKEIAEPAATATEGV